jgi:acyl-coenzyme A thioesterase PaaI-like protein
MTIEHELEKWARENLPIYEYMDMRITSVSDGLYQCRVPLSENTGNHIGTVHAAFQWASVEILGGLVVLSSRKDEKYVPVVKGLSIEFTRPALTDITSEAFFSREQAEEMNSVLASTDRFDFDLNSVIKDADGNVVAEALGHYAVRIFG